MHQADAEEAEVECVKVAEGFFSQYANLLSTEQRILWEKIAKKKINTASWTYLKGQKHLKAQGKTQKSFLQCTTHHLLIVFNMDATEQQWHYISNAFFTRVEQINSYIKLLPSLYNSPKAMEFTKPA
jgi:hypothetical protein